jgi:hypothetical protein
MKKCKNPFIYGGKITGDAFCDRNQEITELIEDIRSRQHVIIYSQRRFGKTSLVLKVLEEVRGHGIIPVYVDLYPVSTVSEFIEEYAKAIARALTPYEKAVQLMRGLFTRLTLSMGVDGTGNPQWNVGFDRSRLSDSFEEVLFSLEHYLKKRKKFGVVVFDEFQQITELDGPKTERRLRSALQTHEKICYFFVGSKKHLLRDIFTSPNRPFYRSGKIFPLNRISTDEFTVFIKQKFERTEVSIEDDAVKLVLEATGSHPYYTQYLCHILYDLNEGPQIKAEDIPKAVDFLISRESGAYMNTWDLLTIRQRQALVALSETPSGVTPLGSETLRKHGMSQPAVMMRALNSLINKDLVDKESGRYEIVDVFFKKWIRSYIVQAQL